MSMTHCELRYRSASPHLQQLYTGFLMLHRSGSIRLSQHLRPAPFEYSSNAPHLKGAGHAHLEAVLNGKVRVHFDTHDAREIAVEELEKSDFYFKRSYSTAEVDALPASLRRKMVPLGLNYRVLPDVIDTFAVRRSIQLHGISSPAISGVKQAIETGNLLGHHPRVSLMQAPPDPAAVPRVLFLVAVYDPHDDPSRSAEKVKDRIDINTVRAQIVARLRAALRDLFIGGIADSEYARREFPDLVVPRENTTQDRYLETVKSTPICIATTGLHGSTGSNWPNTLPSQGLHCRRSYNSAPRDPSRPVETICNSRPRKSACAPR